MPKTSKLKSVIASVKKAAKSPAAGKAVGAVKSVMGISSRLMGFVFAFAATALLFGGKWAEAMVILGLYCLAIKRIMKG